MKIQLNEFGKHVGTRNEAIRLREKLLSALRNSESVYIDFLGVKSISSIFAGELFGKLTDDYDLDKIAHNLICLNSNGDINLIIDKAFKKKLEKLEMLEMV